MDKFERGKRTNLDIYDDAWIWGDDGSETIVPSSSLSHDKINVEEYSEIMDIILTSEQIKSLLNKSGEDQDG